MSAHVDEEEEYLRRGAALFKVLDDFGLPSPPPLWVDNSVYTIVETVMTEDASALGVSGMRALRRGKEREKLRRLRVLAKKLTCELRALDPRVLILIKIHSWRVFPLQDQDDRGRFRLLDKSRDIDDDRVAEELSELFWEALGELDMIVDHITPGVNRDIDAAPESGRRDLVSVVVIDHLRAMWEEALGRGTAPKSITDAGEFADFIVKAFEVLGLQNNCRAAMDSWREYHRKYGNDGWYY